MTCAIAALIQCVSGLIYRETKKNIKLLAAIQKNISSSGSLLFGTGLSAA
jgi:hypothetical protein